jgi:hypothetical protein
VRLLSSFTCFVKRRSAWPIDDATVEAMLLTLARF